MRIVPLTPELDLRIQVLLFILYHWFRRSDSRNSSYSNGVGGGMEELLVDCMNR